MKSNFSHIGLAKLCGWFGISRQAYYQNNWEGISTTLEEDLVIQRVKEIRKKHRRMGTRKLYEMLQPFLLEHQIKIGRDGLFNLLSSNHLLIRKRKRRIQTTNSYHWLRKYPNLIREFVPTAPNQLWVSDITYWKINTGEHLYISLITDAYSHKIVGYQVAETMEAIESIEALHKALSALGAESLMNLIHHSDRGIQYCSHAYVKLLQDNGIKISMTENGNPLENAVAERINGIIKDEYLETYDINNINEAKTLLKDIVNLYNSERPHMSISNLTPNHIHHSKTKIKIERLWKNYYRKNPTIVNPNQD
ncbi:MAG: IS3 family transposase [Chitinophagales bacterium]|jgi:putative transposase|nr:IS3 family transposase [Chitinophagales bacterium]HRN71094.1 IS3 family transposase [Candidatus Woesebacteria bacterium]MCO5233904.1 IS3 family transposase [Chitinophagales bacterium]MCO5234518.1 IS3 family transposase [Chitinophagales bacterium]MCO5234526.1 IS3 family transposase [Chitinophagales bacterium]